MTFGEIMWLFLGAAIGAIAGCAIPYAAGVLARLLRKPTSGAWPEVVQIAEEAITSRKEKPAG